MSSNSDASDILDEILEDSKKPESTPEPQPEPEPQPQPQPQPQPEPQPEIEDSDDPFEGIETDDINDYADMYDVPPPETDGEAKNLATKIKKWIQDGRPKP